MSFGKFDIFCFISVRAKINLFDAISVRWKCRWLNIKLISCLYEADREANSQKRQSTCVMSTWFLLIEATGRTWIRKKSTYRGQTWSMRKLRLLRKSQGGQKFAMMGFKTSKKQWANVEKSNGSPPPPSKKGEGGSRSVQVMDRRMLPN